MKPVNSMSARRMRKAPLVLIMPKMSVTLTLSSLVVSGICRSLIRAMPSSDSTAEMSIIEMMATLKASCMLFRPRAVLIPLTIRNDGRAHHADDHVQGAGRDEQLLRSLESSDRVR